jgi:hypothetical protein
MAKNQVFHPLAGPFAHQTKGPGHGGVSANPVVPQPIAEERKAEAALFVTLSNPGDSCRNLFEI